MQAALSKVKGVSKATVGTITGVNADATVTADSSVKVADLIKALEAKGFTAKEKMEDKKAA